MLNTMQNLFLNNVGLKQTHKFENIKESYKPERELDVNLK